MKAESDAGQTPALRLPKRKAVSASQQDWVREEFLTTGDSAVPVLRPAVRGVDLVAWAARHRDEMAGRLKAHGSLLFRGFDVPDTSAFQQFIVATSHELMEYRDRTSPRSPVSEHVYTSTNHPADQSILLHNENSYSAEWPAKIYFHCVTPASEGGSTPLADCRRVLRRISREVLDTFERKQVMYVRNFGSGFGLPWQTTFQTDEPGEVEQFCRGAGIEFEWLGGDRLRTRQVRPAVATHPQTGEAVWFNQANLFHVGSLPPQERTMLLAEFAEEDLPSQSYFGDGSPIGADMLDEINDAYRRERFSFPWHAGDILLLDNMLTAHGREPFRGERKVVVGMADPTGWPLA